MSIAEDLCARAQNMCELCGASDNLDSLQLPDSPAIDTDSAILACEPCRDQFAGRAPLDVHHWRCLNDSAWSQTPAVQVAAWRLLTRLNAERWAIDLRDMLYLDDETLAWANADSNGPAEESAEIHKDSNGALLENGDTVTLIKDLNVKGAGFTAKRGTAVRNISLVHNNPAHIEGRVNGQLIVILTEFVKKSG